MLVHVIEENVAVRLMLASLLEMRGYRVRLFDDAAQCLAAADNGDLEMPDALLADLRYSRLSFPDETERLCRRFSGLPWLMMSFVPEMQALLRQPLALPKPFAPARVEAALSRLKSRPAPAAPCAAAYSCSSKLPFDLSPVCG